MASGPPPLAHARRGMTANGVPFVALAPHAPAEAEALVVLWHGADPPRTEEALAGAVPLRELPAWRVYLGMPGHGVRTPPGGIEEIMRLGAEDAITLLFHPRIEGAVAELREAVEDVCAQLAIDRSLPLGVFGFSQGGAAALLAVGRRVLPFKAAVTFGAIIDLAALVDTLGSLFGTGYEWTAERRQLARQMSSTHRARELADSGAAVLLGVGEEDQESIRASAQRLAGEIRAEGGRAEVRVLPHLGHAFVDEPGVTAVAQGAAARTVDQMASDWFSRHLLG